MRDDFAKVLVERPRFNHHDCYGNHRHTKAFKEDEMYFGGREPMKKRYNSRVDRKSFNEHLSPLKGWLRSVVGKQWDKSYSELRQKFDARSTINNHILEHLWDYVETHAFVQNGKTMCHVRYAYGNEYTRIVPIKECSKEYYVCPKDGTLKKTNKAPYKAIRRAQVLSAKEAEAKIFRVLDENTHLHFVDGVWFACTIKPLPPSTIEYRKPLSYGTAPQLFKRGYMPHGKMVPWEDLSQSDKERYGRQVITGIVTDALSHEKIYRTTYLSRTRRAKDIESQNHASKAGHLKYYDSKFTASHKLLKQAGLDGTAAANDESMLSHREAAKYRTVA